MLAAADTLLLGRTTYQTFAAAFSGDSDGNPMAEQMNSFHKVVVSTTLASADWHNSTLISDKVTEQIADLKSQPGGGRAASRLADRPWSLWVGGQGKSDKF